MDSLSTKRNFRERNVTKKEEPTSEGNFGRCGKKAHIGLAVVFLDYVQFLNLRLVLKLSIVQRSGKASGPRLVEPTDQIYRGRFCAFFNPPWRFSLNPGKCDGNSGRTREKSVF